MKNIRIVLLTIGLCSLQVITFAQGKQVYKMQMSSITDNTIKVALEVDPIVQSSFKDTAFFLFPKTIPGTYAVLDYGRYIENMTATDAKGIDLKVVKKGNNEFQIIGKPAKVNYVVRDTYHTKTKKNKIFEPAGTNIQKDRNILINAAGYYGYFKGTEQTPIALQIENQSLLYGLSSLPQKLENNQQVFEANNYHQLIDNPIMYSVADTTSFMVANCKVTIGVFSESGSAQSKAIYEEVKTSMQALAVFFNQKLPVDHYTFIIYLKDLTEYKDLFSGEKVGIFELISVFRRLSGQGFGALEHGTSSVYFLPDFGNDFAIKMVKDVATHEFLHILTPLSLHSERIGDFNYENPLMSKHLWMYEGITEYFAGLAQVQNDVLSNKEYLTKVMVDKIKEASSFPFTKMSMTEMSENVFDEPYKKQYGQVYQRGALLGACLDIEIISLTKGEKTLKDVLLALSAKYGKDSSFSEASFISEFVAASHPGVQVFFDKYITGRDTLAIAEIFAKAGVVYIPKYEGLVPVSPAKGVKFRKLTLSGQRTIKKVKKESEVPFKKGDQLPSGTIRSFAVSETGFTPEGEKLMLKISRDGKEMELPVVVKYENGTKEHHIYRMANMTAEQELVFRRWLKE